MLSFQGECRLKPSFFNSKWRPNKVHGELPTSSWVLPGAFRRHQGCDDADDHLGSKKTLGNNGINEVVTSTS